jgi:hypothetical protein
MVGRCQRFPGLLIPLQDLAHEAALVGFMNHAESRGLDSTSQFAERGLAAALPRLIGLFFGDSAFGVIGA